jgi:hypothetical protein
VWAARVKATAIGRVNEAGNLTSSSMSVRAFFCTFIAIMPPPSRVSQPSSDAHGANVGQRFRRCRS